MTLRERFDKLEPRERRLLMALGGVLGVCLLLLRPVGVYGVMSGKRNENRDLRDLIDKIYESRSTVAERKAKREAIVARYARPAPALAGFIEEAAKENSATASESQDQPDTPHGKRYNERTTVVRIPKIGMLALAKTLEKIEQSGHPVAITKLTLKPRAGEPDSYQVEIGVSAYDRKPDAPTPAPAGSAAADKDKDKEKE